MRQTRARSTAQEDPPAAQTLTPLDPPLKEVMRKLYASYGRPELDEERDDILAMSIEALLSQATNRKNFTQAFHQLLERFEGDWGAIAHANVEEIEGCIRVGGLAARKAARIQAILHRVHDLYGDYTLEPLHDEAPERAYEVLIDMPGIGPKTATFVLMRAAKMPFFSMSERILRVCQRLGWGTQECSSKVAHDTVLPHIPEGEHDPFHVALIEHGSKRCTPKNPACRACALRDICAYGLHELNR